MMLKRFIAAFAVACLFSPAAQAQKTKAALTSEIDAQFPDNVIGAITPQVLRSVTTDIIDSYQQYGAVNAQTGTSYIVALSDYGQLVTFNNSSAVAVSLPQATAAFATFNFYARNRGTGNVTITPTVSTIDGATSFTLVPNQSIWVVSDGANYQVWNATIGAGSFPSESANTFFAGPTSGGAASPGFRILVGADLPLPTTSSLGGVESVACASHNWITKIPGTMAQPTCAQPAFSDLGGNISVNQMNGGASAGAATFWNGLGVWTTAVTSMQLTAGAGISISVNSGANPCVTSCNLTVAANNSMGANKIQVFSTAGGTGTITIPTGAAWAKFTLIGGGASGTGSGTGGSPGQGAAGNNTCINTSGSACTSPVYEAGGGGQPSTWGGAGNGGTGGTCSGSGTFLLSIPGGDGGAQAGNASVALGGPAGGASGLGYGHGGAAPKGANGASGSGYGGGGQGGGVSATASSFTGPAGGGGAGCVAFIQNPTSSYTYAIANMTTGGVAGTNGFAGGGGSGGLIIAEFGFN